ncbi:PLP-dependent aminotransferase family protein [Rhizobium sp. TRM95796]|uniref:aminotransferase-like domain-containing protein n=1 Tax=Rhizobium sp. TRM95796 TaxID=2979862 RepID=UPI0021E98BC8|nr:PLP-dependent aminotransferase family protein [Rhizobium sp. TRM95796]MCV3767785.1 PLP-dependent aminotransferase family protein [Rhizobium sp. TRM95796]
MSIKEIQFGEKPGYAAIVSAIVDAIARRKLVAGERLPPQRELSHQLGVAIATVGRAYTQLEQQGFVVSHVGRGTFIAGGRMVNASSEAPLAETIDLSTYKVPVPDIDTTLADTLKTIIAEHHPQQLLGASPTAGTMRHREVMADWLARFGLAATAGQIIITNGGQHATMAALSTLTHAGETIATEELTDPRMKSVASYLDRKLVGVAIDENGMIPESLAELCRDHPVSAIYVTPRAQNPTNATLPAERRIAIAEIARRHDLPIIESDIYGTLFSEGNEPPIAAIAPERTHFITSLGRISGPGMKVGCLVSPLADVARTQSGVGMSTGSASLIAVEIGMRWVADNRLDSMIRWQQAENIRRLSLLATFPMLSAARTHVASPHVWLSLPEQWRAEDFVNAAAGLGVSIAPTHSFMVGRRTMPHAVRLVIGSPSSVETLQMACERLERLLNAQPKGNFEG